MEEQIEVITYEQDRLNYFTDLMKKAQERYKRLFKKHKDAPYASEEAQALSDAGRETRFLGDVVGMLEKGYCKQSEGEWIWEHDALNDPKRYFVRVVCTCCGLKTGQTSNFCPKCGAKMKGGGKE